MGNTTTSAFTLGVAEEFVIVCAITIIAYMTSWYYLWLGTFIVFSIHLVVHCVQAFILKGYVPAIVTSVICLPLCLYIICVCIAAVQASFELVMLFSVFAFIIMMINLAAIHKGMDIFDKWLVQYQNK